MITKIDLAGEWTFKADEEMLGAGSEFIEKVSTDTIFLPSTTSLSGKGRPNADCEEYHLTDVYPYEGYAWFSKTVEIGELPDGAKVHLFLERTRITDLWVNGKYVGSCNSLCTPHIYDITPYITDGKAEICVRVCNTGYPTKGGHMTSPDTQTNWNGITGELSLRLYEAKRISRVRAFPDVANRTIELEVTLDGTDRADISVWGASSDGNVVDMQTYSVSSDISRIRVYLGEKASLWSAETPVTYTLKAAIFGSSDIVTVKTGLRDFAANGREFTINGEPVYLRGKHDAMVFSLTGAAPTTIEEWHNVFIKAKSWGINHYRFHTCCPPEAAFAAADIAGIYLQTELPFWGDIPDEENEELRYLMAEGKRILDEFGDHPSFVMMSLGNELWGSRSKLSDMLREFKEYDDRHLYTQGSNNHQFKPEILPYDDFFSGVRFDRERLIRGSYGACDKPYGFIQSEQPNTSHSYDDIAFSHKNRESVMQIPDIPIITHEIGQYSVFPDIDERNKYTGPLKARYMDIYEDRLRRSGMISYADKLHEASGMLAFNCYKLEIEAALRSKNIAGFQLLDLQDFPGQCVALVGMLDPFMDEKKFVRRNDIRRKWNGFCSDIVILAEFSAFVLKCGETLTVPVWIRNMSVKPITGAVLKWDRGSIKLTEDIKGLYYAGEVVINAEKTGTFTVSFQLYDVNENLISENGYDLWAYSDQPALNELPAVSEYNGDKVYITSDLIEAESLLADKKKVLYLPNVLRDSITGTYCTDFWSYPMFRYISENKGCEPPVGTLGLLIDNEHPALKGFDSRSYSTPQWYNIVNDVKCAVLDGTPDGYRPIVQMIDNSERCHKLGILYEAKVGDGCLMVCTASADIEEFPETAVFFQSILDYMHSDSFEPEYRLAAEELDLR